MCAQSYYLFYFVIYMFLTIISRDDGNFGMQLNFYKELHSYSWFFSWASIKDRELIWQWKQAGFFNENIQQKQYYSASGILLGCFCHTNLFVILISHPTLNWIYDRKLEKLASSTWSLHAFVLYELFMIFSELKIWIGLLFDLMHRKYMLFHLVNT